MALSRQKQKFSRLKTLSVLSRRAKFVFTLSPPEWVSDEGTTPVARQLEGKIAAVTGAASGIGLASTEAMLADGARVVMIDRDEAALKGLSNKHGDAVMPLVIDLLDPKDCATLLPRALEKAGPSTSCMQTQAPMWAVISSMPIEGPSTGC
jgi:short chain dehydrogenase